jgi:hypothetical protein
MLAALEKIREGHEISDHCRLAKFEHYHSYKLFILALFLVWATIIFRVAYTLLVQLPRSLRDLHDF